MIYESKIHIRRYTRIGMYMCKSIGMGPHSHLESEGYL